MSLRANQLYAGGETVWAQMGSYGWSAAIVTRPGRRFVELFFPARKNGLHGEKTSGKRLPEQLRPRNPKLDDRDKPLPALKAFEQEQARA